MKKPRRLLVIVIIVLGLGAAGVPLFKMWRSHVQTAQDARSFQAVEKLLNEGRHAAARSGLQNYLLSEGSTLTPEQQHAWRGLDVRVSEKLRDLSRLLILYQKSPELYEEHEAAALLVARVLGVLQETDEALPLREQWRGRETLHPAWLALDADQLMRKGQTGEAIQLLKSQSFSGPADCGRLLRLAMLYQSQDSVLAARYMTEAFAADPKNPDVRSFQGQLLENAGQPELARVEYVAALVIDPRDAFRRQQLAAFYIRQGNYALAQQTLATATGAATPEFIGLAGEFWTRMLKPGGPQAEVDPDTLTSSLLPILRAQPKDVFWNAKAVSKLTTLKRYEQQQQEVFWLQLIQLLRDGEESKAAEMLEVNRFRAVSFSPDLESALRIVLRYRATKTRPSIGDFPPGDDRVSRHVLFEQINAWSSGALGDARPLPLGTERFLRGPQAFAGLLLATGWVEAALQLTDFEQDFNATPDWWRFGLAQALRFNRSPEEALAFLEGLAVTESTQLLRGEILIAQNKADEARKILAPLVKLPTDVGYRATWLLATLALEADDPDQAEALIRSHDDFYHGVTGQELLARCALSRSDEDQARLIYTTLGRRSMEAATYLARQAFADRQWQSAREWTEFLFERYPDELQLRANLIAIANAEKEETFSKP